MISSASSSNNNTLISSTVVRALASWVRIVPALAGVILISLMTVASSRAVSVIPPDFTELVTEATQIVRVRITEVSTRWDDSQHGRVIHTYVQGETIRTLKGANQEKISLRLLGGQVGNTSMEVADMPAFEVGQTYILFIAGNGEAFCPLVGIMHGTYPVLTDNNTGSEYVARSNRQPLANVDDVALPIITQSNHPALRLTSKAGLPTGDFESAIAKELNRSNKS